MRIAFVIPWFGPDLKGGSEQQAWQLATRLAARGHAVDALTTCCRSFLEDWAVNHLAPGTGKIAGVEVRRFPVDARDRPAFDRLNASLLSLPKAQLRPGISPVAPENAAIWTSENINSRLLEKYITENVERYDAFIFIPYLYGPTLRGLHRAADKAWMQPCFHDEAYAYLPDSASATYAARGLLFNSAGERELAARLYGPAIWAKGHVTGEGIEFAPLDADRAAELPDALKAKRFVLFLGRRDPGKGVDLLLESFARMDAPGRDLTLVLAGPGERDYGAPEKGVVDLGLVSDEVRVAVLRECTALMLPSPNESFSRVLYEAWYVGKPAVVRRCCDATRLAVEACEGGWVAESAAEWTDLLAMLGKQDADSPRVRDPGERGRRYALEHADWDRVIDRYEAILVSKPLPRGFAHAEPPAPAAIHQMSPVLGYGDAISNEMLSVRKILRAAGYRSDIIVAGADPMVASEAVRFSPIALRPDDGLIYHHSIGSEITSAAMRHPGPKGLIYHNITPASFFLPFRPDFARLLRDGREEMWSLARAFPVSAGDSAFNASELGFFGFEDPGVLPLEIDPSSWNLPPSPGWMEALADGRKNVLFVGRCAPNKRQDRLVEAFAEVRAVLDARLVLAGSMGVHDPYSDHVRTRVKELGLEADVVLVGHCTHADLHAFYRSAHAFWSFSEHEGFCVPLIEAMWFDIPIVALASSAVPETLAGAGRTFAWTDDNVHIADIVQRVLTDEAMRAAILERQRSRRLEFAGAKTAAALAGFVHRMTLARGRTPSMADA